MLPPFCPVDVLCVPAPGQMKDIFLLEDAYV